MNRRETLAAELEALRTEMLELADVEEPTEEQAARMDAITPEWDAKKADYDKVVAADEKLEQVRSAALDPGNREDGTRKAPEFLQRKDPFKNLDAVRGGYVSDTDLRARALTGIEQAEGIEDDYKEQASKLVGRSKGVARLAMLTGAPAYRSAFEKILEFPDSYSAFLTEVESEALRTAMSTTTGSGGYAIPFLLDPSVILTNSGATNPFRAVATIKQGTSNVWNGLSSAGVTAEWKTEGSEAADASPTFGQPTIPAYAADAYVFGSYEVLQDTNLATELPALIADAKDRLEADAFAVGSGSGAPTGVVTAVTAATNSRVSPTTGGSFTTASIADVYKVIAAVPPRHRSAATWVANFTTYNTIRQMSASAQGSSFWANLGANMPEELLGRPIIEASQMVATSTTGSNILLAGNFARYYIYDRIGMSLEYIQNVVGENGRPTGQRGWFAFWRTGATAVDPNAFRVLKL